MKLKVKPIAEETPELRELSGSQNRENSSPENLPSGFDGVHRSDWNRLVDLASNSGSQELARQLTLELLFDTYLQYAETSRKLLAEGFSYSSSSNHTSKLKRKHPLLDANRDLRKQMLALLKILGVQSSAGTQDGLERAIENDPAEEFFST